MTKQIVGITACQNPARPQNGLNITYMNAVEQAGAVPVIVQAKDDIGALVSTLDALVLSGGEDISPRLYGEQARNNHQINEARDRFEMALAKEMMALGKPVLGVCRGAQLLNAILGGTLYQDIEKETGLVHPLNENHLITTLRGSQMAKALGDRTLVNSRHHQACRTLGEGLTPSAFSEDGIIEAFENEQKRLYGVQFHPEEVFAAEGRLLDVFKLIL